MNPQDPLSSFLESPYLSENLLRIPERELIAAILRHAEDYGHTPENKRCLEEVLSRAVGEIILQRAAEKIGTRALNEIQRRWESSRKVEPASTIFAGPPSPAPTPRPPSPSPAPSPHGIVGDWSAGASAAISAGPPSPAPTPRPPSPAPAPGPHASTVLGRQTSVVDPIVDADYVLFDEFLAPAELQELTCFTLDHEAQFCTSEVISPGVGAGLIDPEHRRSRVLMDLAHFERLIFRRIQSALPIVLDKLGIPTFPITRFEAQITASNDGDFFRHHTDNAEEEIATRQLTFVYFFHREPKAFHGGELRIHNSHLEDGLWRRAGDGKTVIPEQNQVVFFRSNLLHEITPVICPSQAFADSRFTVNGWLHR